MFTLAMWWCTNALMGLLLIRALRGHFFLEYPLFYSYLSYVLAESLLRLYVYVAHPQSYGPFYWGTQFLSVTLGYGVIVEIYKRSLVKYPGAARMAQTALLIVFFGVLLKTSINALHGAVWSVARTTAELERNLRTVQTILLMVLLVLLVYYLIPLGRNLRGMVAGYGFYIGVSVISLTMRSHLRIESEVWWQYVQPLAYAISVIVWCSTLWSYSPNTQPENDSGIERDYEFLASGTEKLLNQMRTYLGRAVRP